MPGACLYLRGGAESIGIGFWMTYLLDVGLPGPPPGATAVSTFGRLSDEGNVFGGGNCGAVISLTQRMSVARLRGVAESLSISLACAWERER